MLAITGLRYRYLDTPVLDDVDVTVAAGEVVSLVGPNGAGKSTLLKCVNRVLIPRAGEVTVGGRPAASYSRRELARLVATVPQQHGNAMGLSVLDMVALGRAPHRGRGSAEHHRSVVLDMIERLRLSDLAMRPFGELSGGERQRVMLARALAQEGRLLLLDEPTSALDLRHQLETMSLVRTIAREQDAAILIAIHDLALAGRFSDRLVLLDRGRVRTSGRWQDVLTREHVEAAYGVDILVGAEEGLPYVIPVESRSSDAAQDRS